MLHKSRLTLLAFGAATSLTLALAACGSSGGSAPKAAESGGSAPASTPSGTPIKIGLAIALTGFGSAANKPVPDVVTAWTKWVDAHGGIGGHPVQVVVKDTTGTPAAAQSVTKELVEQEHVVAMLMQDGATESTVGSYLTQMNIPVIGSLGFDYTLWDQKPNYFNTNIAGDGSPRAIVMAAEAAGGTTIGTAICAEVAGCVHSADVIQAFATPRNMKYGGTAKVAVGAPSYTAQCLNFINSHTDAIALEVTTDVAQKLIQDCDQQGYKGVYLTSPGTGVIALVSAVKGSKIGGTLSAFPWWIDAAPVKDFRSALAQYAPKVDIASNYVTAMWTSLELFRKAVSASPDDLTPAKVTDAYYSLKNETLGGLLPQPLTFTTGQPHAPISCFWSYTYTVGDAGNPKVHQSGTSGNGASGDLSSTCLPKT